MRLPYTPNPPPTSDPETASIVSRIRERRSPRPLQALDLTLLHSPNVADGWNSFLGAIRTKTSLEDDVREIAICRVAICNKAWYEWAHHAPLAKAGGVSESGMKTLAMEKIPEDIEAGTAGLTPKQMAILRYSDAMTLNVTVPSPVFDSLKEYFSDKEIVEITATVAAYNCVSRFLVALDVGERNGTGPSGEETPSDIAAPH